MAVAGEISPLAIETAINHELPVFQLPAGSQLMQVERTVIRLIVDRDSYIAQRSADLQRELNQIALDGGGLQRLAEQLYRFSQEPVVLLRGEGKVTAVAGLDDMSKSGRQALLNSIPNIMALRSWAAQQPVTDLAGAVGTLMLESTGEKGFQRAVVSPVFANDAVRGFCMVLRGAGSEVERGGGDHGGAGRGRGCVGMGQAERGRRGRRAHARHLCRRVAGNRNR